MSNPTPIDDGGPAFPCGYNTPSEGMTLRDWFAGQALAGLLAGLLATEGTEYSHSEDARNAYAAADAMLAARKRGAQ